MMKKWLPCFVVAVIISSCHLKDAKTSVVAPKRNFYNTLNSNRHLNYRFDIHNETKTTIRYAGDDITTANIADVGLNCAISADSEGHSIIKATFQKMIIELHNKDIKQVIDASSEDTTDALTRIFKGFIGSCIEITMDSAGNVIKVVGADDLRSRVLASASTLDENTRKIIGQQISKLGGPDFFIHNLQEQFSIFPDSAVHVNDQWTKTATVDEELKLTMNAQYTLENLEDTVAKVAVHGLIIKTPQSISNASGMLVNSDLSGKQKGWVEVNINTGIISNSKMTSEIDGTMEAMGTVVPVEIRVKKEIRSVRL